MNKVKKIKIILPLLVVILFTIFMIIRANKGFPRKEKIERFALNEYVDCGDISIKVTDKKIVGEGTGGFPISAISFTIKNNTSKPVDISPISDQIILYSNFDGSVIQNVDRGLGGNDEFNIFYSKEDLKLDSNEEKEFDFNYYMYKDIDKYENFIYLDNNLYKKEYDDYLKKGIMLYKIIKLGDFNE